MGTLKNGGENEIESAESKAAIPAARPLSDFSYEEVGGDLVLFDAETMQYHTLNPMARTIWQSCDGIATVETIAVLTGLPSETIEATIAELAEASLLIPSTRIHSMSINRRRAAKMVAGGIIGLPVVLSITAPDASAQMSPASCVGNAPCSGYAAGTQCTSGGWTFVCCYGSGGYTGWIYAPNVAESVRLWNYNCG